MAENELSRSVAAHYGRSDLTVKILRAIGIGGEDEPPPSLSALTKFDQMHHGGLGLTKQLAACAGVSRGMRVLDAGSGIGGSARHLVDAFAVSVEAIDLTPELVKTAAELDAVVGMSDSINHRVGSVTDLPFQDQSFDLVWCQNVTMNIADKPTMFSEALRVLRPGGVFAFTHLAEGYGNPLVFPLPWARTPETSFLGTPDEVLEVLVSVGFGDVTDHPQAPLGPAPPKGEGPDDHVVMGNDGPIRLANSIKAVADGRLVPMMVTARRPV